MDGKRIEEIVNNFGTIIDATQPGTFYDVAALPYEKDEIREALLAAISLTDDLNANNHLEGGMIYLTQYQEGVGPEPLSALPIDTSALSAALDAGKISVQESAAKVAAAGNRVDKTRIAELQAQSEKEAENYLSLISEARKSPT